MQENIEYFKYIDNFSKYKEVQSVLLFGSNQDSPLITIAIPTYKRIHLLKEAIESCLNQVDFFNYEIVIVDNDNDFTNREVINLLSKYNNDNIKYYKNEKNIGMFGNWNRCIELARGEYISILNDDDWLEKDFLKIISSEIDGKKAIYTKTKSIDFREKNKSNENNLSWIKDCMKKLENIRKVRKYGIEDFFFYNRSAGSLGILFHKESFKELGGYNEIFFPSSDYYYHSFYCYRYGAKLIKKELCNYRIQENESMKLETASKWPEIDDRFRKYLYNLLGNKKLLKYIKYLKANQAKWINTNWNHDLKYREKDLDIKIKIYMFFREKIKNIF